MIKIMSLILISVIFGGCSMIEGLGSANETYQNPIGEMVDIGDPAILKVDDYYYMYATSAPTIGFLVWESENLTDWEQVGLAYDHENQEEQWARGDFWAPEVVEYNGEFYMAFTARGENDEMAINIAKSDSPTGPFKDIFVDITNQEGSFIDASLFIDDDGTPYLYYVRDNRDNIIDGRHVSQLVGVELSDDLTEMAGEPQFLLQPDQEWETQNEEVDILEGPFMVKHEDTYYLMYTGNAYWDPFYAVGYAVSDSPLGEFEKNENNPILSKDLEQGISGPGHNTVTVGLDDETLYAVYHIHADPENPGGNRRPAIDRLYFEDGEMKVDGPTSDEQPLN